jgi:lambda family phage portal protein
MTISREMSPILDASGNHFPKPQASCAPYRGGAHSRLWKDWLPQHRAGDDAIAENWDLLTARMRDLFRNDPVMKNAKRALAKHVIGTGIQTFAEVMASPEETDDEFNFEADDLFEQWAEYEADAEGKFSFWTLQWLHFCETMESGDSFLLKCSKTGRDRTLPLCYQLLEPEQLDQTQDWPFDGRTKCVRGIEYNADDEPVAYWFWNEHPHDSHAGLQVRSTRIPADRVNHSFLPNRASENRGVTWFSADVQSSRDLDWFLGNELTAAALGALLTIIVKRANGAGTGLGFAGGHGSTVGDSDDLGNKLVKLGRGTVADIGPDDDIKVAESSRPNRDAAPFINLILGQLAMGAGISRLRLTGDYSQSSYTSARGAHLDDQAFFVVLQSWAGRSFVMPIRREWTRQAAAFGLFRTIGARQFKAREREMLRATLQPPGREQLDPDMETTAAKGRISGIFSTWQDECGLRGRNWRRVALQQKRERAFFKKHGLEPDLGAKAPAPPAAKKTNAEEDL